MCVATLNFLRIPGTCFDIAYTDRAGHLTGVLATMAGNAAKGKAMLNRSAIILKYKPPFIDWINSVDPGGSEPLDAEEANNDATVYLIDVEDEDECEDWLRLNWRPLFEEELEGWYADESLWPEALNYELFRAWITVDFHAMVVDTSDSPLEDDDLE